MPLEVSFTQLHKGSFATISFSIKYSRETHENLPGPFNIDNLAEVWFKVDGTSQSQSASTPQIMSLSIRMSKHKLAKDATVKLNVTCDALKYTNQFNCPEISTYWVDMGSFTNLITEIYSLDVNMSVCKISTITFAKLFYDTEVTDFQLSTLEGSVSVHRACLAAHSDVFKAMLNKQWKESTEGKLELKGVTLQTLQHLKEYMYLGTLPDDGLHQLLLVAKCYMIENLQEECIQKLAQTVTFLNLYTLLQFACENNIPELTFSILQHTPTASIHSAYQMYRLKQGCKQVEVE